MYSFTRGNLKKALFILIVLSCMFLFTFKLLANVPAPPANQQLGMPDSTDSYLEASDCRLCHENPDQFPLEDETISNRHHLLYGTVIPQHTDAPYGISGELYECLSCHAVQSNGGVLTFLIERDCIMCHTYDNPSELNVHHQTDLALGNLPQGPDCKVCHGSLVNNMEDGHFISEEPPSDTTPKRSGGTGLPLNSEGNGAGACDYCHSTGSGNESRGLDTATGISVFSNKQVHHLIFRGGTGGSGSYCIWCHDFNLPLEEQIRVCENCHGRDVLHNIQVDSDGNGIINPGVELPGYGHIGNPEDCWGCHGFSFQTSITSLPSDLGPVIPHVYAINASVITAGHETVLTVTGSGFTNLAHSIELLSSLRLTATDGLSVELIPNTISEGEMTVTIPGNLTIGNYALRAVKLGKLSNPMVISITPEVVISNVSCNEGILTITGSGFGDAPPEGAEAYINIEIDDVPVGIISWTDTKVEVSVSNCSGTVTVNALYGSDTYGDSDCEVCYADCNHDGTVDLFDLAILKTEFSRTDCDTTNPCQADCNGDGSVDIFDLIIMKVHFLKDDCCQ
jgi:hypothetical protein